MTSTAQLIRSMCQSYANVIAACNPDTVQKATDDYMTGRIDLAEFEARLERINAGSETP